jgi:acyl-CoA oxidase
VILDPIFKRKTSIPLVEERTLASARLKKICEGGFISVLDFERNPLNIFAVHETLGQVDSSLATKLTVQFNLFGGTLLKLGDANMRKMVPSIDSLSDIGCFGLTELGYGNNAVEMETTSMYDPSTEEFVVNSPSTLSQKFWITNSAVDAKWIIVFAQLHMIQQSGAVIQEGVHAFLVRIRDEQMQPMPGVRIEDMGRKIGANGVDNGKLWFDHVRIPRTALLSKYSKV